MNILIGAITNNLGIKDIKRWAETSTNWKDVKRVLIRYGSDPQDEVADYCFNNGIETVYPSERYDGVDLVHVFDNTAYCNTTISYDLVHNLRFLHIAQYLDGLLIDDETAEQVLITDVRDVMFNRNPFDVILGNNFVWNKLGDGAHLIATSEEVLYKNHPWNLHHLGNSLGTIGVNILYDRPVYNVGVVMGDIITIRDLCRDIYLIAAGKPVVADQTAFNYLIHTKYGARTFYSGLDHNFAVHLHVIMEGHVNFDMSTLNNYAIIHQYDRFPHLMQSNTQ